MCEKTCACFVTVMERSAININVEGVWDVPHDAKKVMGMLLVMMKGFGDPS